MAVDYDRHVAPFHAPFANRVLDDVHLRSGERVVDVGCGTGMLTLAAASSLGPRGVALGIDVARGMVAQARQNAARSGIPTVAFLRMDARNLAWRDSSMDAVVSCLGLPFIGWRGFFAEAYRVLHPGGRIVACEWAGGGTAVTRIFRELLNRAEAGNPPQDILRLEEARACLREIAPQDNPSPDEWPTALASLGFRDPRCVRETIEREFPAPDDYIAYMGAFADIGWRLTSMGSAAQITFRREFASAVRPFRKGSRLVVPGDVLIYIASKPA